VDALTFLTADPPAAALFLDVDGVLAPIVERPEDARVPAQTREELRRLARSYGLVAAITGRTSAFAREIVGVDSLTYAGQHGLELDSRAEEWAPHVRAFAAEIAWGDVELKPLTAAFHFRSAADESRARRELEPVAEAATAAGLRARWGRMVLEILPPIDVSKGTAVRALLEQTGLRHALYAGDDTTDLDGFAALDGLEGAIRVAVVSPESPGELASRADIVVESTEAFFELLLAL